MSETRPARRARLSPALRAFVAVDVVLVLALVAVLLVTRAGSGDDPPAATRAPETSSEATGTASTPGTDDADATPAPDPSAPAETDEAELFASPSGNILCSISPDAASCSIAQLADGGIVEDDACDGTVGHVVRVTEEGAERPCVGGRPPGKAPNATPQLDYEESTSAFGYTCTSSRSGVICRHDATGHGFSIARAGSSLF